MVLDVCELVGRNSSSEVSLTPVAIKTTLNSLTSGKLFLLKFVEPALLKEPLAITLRALYVKFCPSI